VQKASALFIATLVLVPAVLSQQLGRTEPYTVKNDRLGETSAEWLASDAAHKNWDCTGMSHPAEGKTASCVTSGAYPEKDTYAGALFCSQSAFFVTRNNKLILYKVEIDLWNDMYLSPLMPALQNKFGQPSGHEVMQLQNSLGAKIEKNTWKWKNGVSSVELEYALGASDDIPVLTFTLDGPAEEVKERQEKHRAEAVRRDM
jgi:hypothetical protein